MTYTASIPEIDSSKLMVLPISMNQPLERGPRLNAILQLFRAKGYQSQVTIILCDYLNRHNCVNDLIALEQGDSFLSTHKEILEGFNIIRWQDFITDNQEKFSGYLEMITTESQDEKSMFYMKMQKTWKKCFSSQSLDASIKYQREEYAAVLCMNKFSYLFYPKKITPALSFLYIYGNKLDIHIPTYTSIRVSEIKKQNDSLRFFSSNSEHNYPKKGNHVHIAFRGVIEQINLFLNTDELSKNSKQIFAEEVENIFMQHGLLNHSIFTNIIEQPELVELSESEYSDNKKESSTTTLVH